SEIVREIFDMYVNQGYGSHKISKILNSRGLTSLRNVKWSATAISRILKNKLYAGYVINGKSEVTDLIERVRTKKDESEWIETARPDLQIVPLEMWEKAQNISRLNNTKLKKNLHKKNSSKHLFSTLITCSVCGYSFRQSKRKNKDDTRIIWLCSGRNHHGAKYCNNKTIIPEDELIKNIDSYFLSIISDKQKFIDSIVSKYESRQQKNPMRELSENLEKLQIKKQKQIMMFENSIITIDELKERVKNIDNAIANIRLELDSTENLKSIEERSRKLYNMLSENFSRYVSVANMTNAEIKTLIKFITADENGNIHIEMNY
ncbi:MAG: recombinase family protein, partial [Oscillospiraceae bacterium]|nr:recombinase family protein [Oscillospiraceae bacterium]